MKPNLRGWGFQKSDGPTRASTQRHLERLPSPVANQPGGLRFPGLLFFEVGLLQNVDFNRFHRSIERLIASKFDHGHRFRCISGGKSKLQRKKTRQNSKNIFQSFRNMVASAEATPSFMKNKIAMIPRPPQTCRLVEQTKSKFSQQKGFNH